MLFSFADNKVHFDTTNKTKRDFNFNEKVFCFVLFFVSVSFNSRENMSESKRRQTILWSPFAQRRQDSVYSHHQSRAPRAWRDQLRQPLL